MARLLVLFIFGFIGLSLRFILKGEFELNQLLLLILFPVASVIIFFIMKYQHNKDLAYKPVSDHNSLVTRLGDRVSTTKKLIYNGENQIGTYHRSYNSWWKRIVADIMDTPGQWYLNLTFEMLNGDQIKLQGINENKIRGNNSWIILWNDQEVGTIQTDYSFKNAKKLRESLYLEYDGKTYHYQSLSVKSKTEITLDHTPIATGERSSGFVYKLEVSDFHKDEEEILFMVYILFNYEFGQ
ncbi:tubby C-terminal domain-like protein [Virgibacillus doumboii]|uniref:tubby C-terminal domain-like protein n=1 Tax=Virgibacillus doumboii TaxID=2697503 RepID=UPI0013DFC1AA|nr:hypothetical protein [Virgibacillus doumboii]